MESSSTSPVSDAPPAPVRSDQKVRTIMNDGLKQMVVQAGAGCLLGGMIGIVVARGGGGTASRKVLAGLGLGAGLGSAWTRTSINLENLLQEHKSKRKPYFLFE